MGKKINIKSLPTEYQPLIVNGRHAIVGDEPTSSTGTDLGFSPEDLILSRTPCVRWPRHATLPEKINRKMVKTKNLALMLLPKLKLKAT